jgi:hypothetical protein
MLGTLFITLELERLFIMQRPRRNPRDTADPQGQVIRPRRTNDRFQQRVEDYRELFTPLFREDVARARRRKPSR